MGIKKMCIFLVLTSLASCGSLSSIKEFENTQRLVAERGVPEIVWRTGGPEDKELDARINDMLANPMQVQQIVLVSLLNNRGLQASYERLNIAQADLVAAGLLKNPVFGFEARLSASSGTGIEMDLLQNFLDILFIARRKRSAEFALETTKSEIASEILSHVYKVREACVNLQSSQQEVEMLQQVVKATEASHDILKRLRAAGNVRELERLREQGLYEEARISLREAEMRVQEAREMLNDLMGLWGNNTSWELSEGLPEVPPKLQAIENLERTAVNKSLQLAIYRSEIEAVEHALGIERASALFSEGEGGVTAEREPEGEWAVGPSIAVPIPLFDSGRIGVAAKTAVLNGFLHNYHAEAVSIRATARKLQAALSAAYEKAQHIRGVLLPLRQDVMRESQLLYNAMQIGPVELLRAKQEQIETGRAYLAALRSFWSIQTDMELLLNGGRVVWSESQSIADEAASSTASEH